MNPIWKLLINATVAFVYLFILSRLLGKKQIAQLDMTDYVIGISLGSIAAEMATDVDTPMYYYLVGMAVFFVLSLLVTLVARKTVWLKHTLRGKPLIIIYDGKLDYDALTRSKMDVNDVLSLIRQQGYFNINAVAFAVFETNGHISVLPKDTDRTLTVKDLSETVQKSQPSILANYLVIDGVISTSGLDELNRDVRWLMHSLGCKTERELDNILLASYDVHTRQFHVHTKEPHSAES